MPLLLSEDQMRLNSKSLVVPALAIVAHGVDAPQRRSMVAW